MQLGLLTFKKNPESSKLLSNSSKSPMPLEDVLATGSGSLLSSCWQVGKSESITQAHIQAAKLHAESDH